MKRKKSRLQIEQEKAEKTIKRTNHCIDELGKYTGVLYSLLEEIQSLFDEIKGAPSDEVIQFKQVRAIRISWKQQVEMIETEYKLAVAKSAGKGAAGAGAGVAVAAMGPSAAMGVATSFGVASTGTAISSLSGAAATNAALAWLGGGALASGGGGIVAGEAFLALAGPIGLAIAGIALLGSGIILFINSKEKKTLEDIYVTISKRDIKTYELAIVELNERINRIESESELIRNAIQRIKEIGFSYNKMTTDEQLEVGSYVNLMRASTQLLVNPILGLQPKYTQEDFDLFISNAKKKQQKQYYIKYRDQLITLANLLYAIKLSNKEKQLLHKSLKNNKGMRYALKLPQKEFKYKILDMTFELLWYQKHIKEKATN